MLSKTQLISTFLIAISSIYKVLSLDLGLNICPVQIARESAMNAYKDPIIKDGVVSPKWYDNSDSPYSSPQEDSIDYFYYLAISNTTNIPTTATITSNDTVNAKPEVKIIEEETPFLQLSVVQKSFQVTYNCKESPHLRVKMKLTIQTSICSSPLEFYWIKVCTPKNHAPSVNIGLTPKTNDIMENGKFKSSGIVSENSSEHTNYKFTIDKDINTMSFYISSGIENKDEPNLVILNPKLIYDENNLGIVVSGQLGNGGAITSNVENLSLNFICMPFKKSISDVQVNLIFKNYDVVDILFTKECDTLGEIQEYFSILYFIYWVLLFLILLFLVAIFAYYLKRTNMTLSEFVKKTIDNIKEYYYRICNKQRNDYEDYNIEATKTSKNNNRLNEYDDKEIVDLDIKDSTINNNQLNKDLVNDIKKMNVESYGGI